MSVDTQIDILYKLILFYFQKYFKITRWHSSKIPKLLPYYISAPLFKYQSPRIAFLSQLAIS